MVAEGNQVAVYFEFKGKHTVISFHGKEANGHNVKFFFMTLLKFELGKIIEKRVHVDVNYILEQMVT